MSVFPYGSFAVTLNEKGVPAVGVEFPVASASSVADAARTVTLRPPVIVALAMSVAVIVCAPALMSVAENVPVPLASVELAGSTTPTEASVVVKCTVPA